MQRINLYTAEFRPQRQWLTPQHCLQLWGALLAIGILIAIAQSWHGHRLRADANALQAEVSGEQTSLEADQAALALRKPSPALGAELDRSNAEEAAKKELLTALQAGVLSGQQGYTPVLVSLARNTIEGLWLTAIEIGGGDVNLKGAARKADFVPVYIDKIVADSGFGPREYRSLKLQTDEKGLLTFELRGHRGEGDNK
jgi:hypothetical protein